MLDSRIWAGPFRDTVEGRPGAFTIEFVNDRPVLRADRPIPKGAKPNPDLVPALLRSGIPLNQVLRDIIADWTDTNAKNALCFKQFKRRYPGRHAAWKETNIEIGLFVEERIDRKENFEAVVAEASVKFGLGRTTVANAYRSIKMARLNSSCR